MSEHVDLFPFISKLIYLFQWDDLKNACVSLDSKKLLNDIEAQISQVRDDLPLTVLDDASNILGDIQREINRYTPEAKEVEYIR